MLSGKECNMPKTSTGKKRPADVASNAVHVMRIATGEVADDSERGSAKNPAAVALGSLGGRARAKALSETKLKKIAKAAARARWHK